MSLNVGKFWNKNEKSQHSVSSLLLPILCSRKMFFIDAGVGSSVYRLDTLLVLKKDRTRDPCATDVISRFLYGSRY